MGNIFAKIEDVITIGLAIFLSVWTCLYIGGVILIDAGIHRGLFIAVILILVFITKPLQIKYVGKVIDLILIIMTITSFGYYICFYNDLIMRAGLVTRLDVLMTILAVLTIIEALRRTVSWVLSLIVLFVLVYAAYGNYLPFLSTISTFSLNRISSVVFLGNSGIFGIPLDIAATYVFIFVLFGAFFSKSGVGQAFLDISFGMFGGFRGGPAKVSIIASGLMGSISGSASANVVTTGVFTIPLMKKVGYSSRFAGAVEAVASTGGMIMPPIMAAAGFLIAQFLGIPYVEVIKMALIPAILYYITLYFAIDAEAARNHIKGIPRSQLPKISVVLKNNWYLFLPLVLLIYLLVGLRWSPGLSGLISIMAIVLISWLKKENRIGIKKAIEAFSESVNGIITVAVACAGAGIIVSIFSLTGIGSRLSSILVELAGSNLYFLLLIVAIIALILGMGLTATAIYLTLIVILAPAIQQFGLPLVVAHMFVFYYACLSNITPPVAIASFAAAGIAKELPMKVAITSARLGIPIYIIPFTFGLDPAYLMIGSPGNITIAFITGLLATFAIASSTVGYALTFLEWPFRIPLFISGLLLLIPEIYTDLIGIALFAVVIIRQYIVSRKVSNYLEETESVPLEPEEGKFLK